jgi:hypothetical protein
MTAASLQSFACEMFQAPVGYHGFEEIGSTTSVLLDFSLAA